MDFLEKDLEQIIFEATEDQLESLDLKGKRFRQLRIGNYGIADLVYIDREYNWDIDSFDEKGYPVETISEYGLKITICELKKDKIGISAFLQAINYCKGIKTYLDKREFYNYNFEILLMGRSIDTSGSFVFITDLVENYSDESKFEGWINKIKFFTYSYGFDGISFKREKNYNLKDSGF